MCELRSEAVDDAGERIRAGTGTIEDVRTWLAWPYRATGGPTTEGAAARLLDECVRLEIENANLRQRAALLEVQLVALRQETALQAELSKGAGDTGQILDGGVR